VQGPQLDLEHTAAFRLGEWLVQPSLNRVKRGATSVQLEPKVMEVLVCLARHAGVVLPKPRIIDAVWQTEFIAEGTLTHAIAELRAVLGDDARSPQYIETITKRGYRLMETVEVVETPDPSEEGVGFECAIVLEGLQIALSAGDNIIGRAADVAIRIDLGEVSRRHARIVVSDDGATLEDLGSKNGTCLWGQRLAVPARLSDGDEIAVGPSQLVFRVLHTTDTTRTARSVDEGEGAG